MRWAYQTKRPRSLGPFWVLGLNFAARNTHRSCTIFVSLGRDFDGVVKKVTLGAECHTLHHGRRPHGFQDTQFSSSWHAGTRLFLISAMCEWLNGAPTGVQAWTESLQRRQLRHGCTITSRIVPLRYRCILAESSHLTTCLALFRPPKVRQST
jgi:hypothetical protein